VKLTVPNRASIAPLGKVFDFIFGRRYFALTTFARVAAISIIALLVSFLVALSLGNWTIKDAVEALEQMEGSDPAFLISSVVSNIVFDYLSVTKSRLLIEWIKRYSYSAIKFVIIDLAVTFFVIVPIFVAVGWFIEIFLFTPSWIYHLADATPTIVNVANSYQVVGRAFTITTFMSLLLTLLYLTSLASLKFFGLIAKAVPLIQWMLPVNTLPGRSIGIVAGAILFCFLELFFVVAR